MDLVSLLYDPRHTHAGRLQRRGRHGRPKLGVQPQSKARPRFLPIATTTTRGFIIVDSRSRPGPPSGV